MHNPAREHVLLTVLGTDPKPAKYVWRERTKESRVASAALYSLLPAEERPSRVIALCTPEAKCSTLLVLRESLDEECPVEPVPVSSSADEDAVHTFLAQLADAVPEGADLTVDVTHGFRHLSFLTYTGVLYLTALRGVRVRAAYYGLLNKLPEESPFLDLRPLVELPDWFHAVRVLKDTGSAHPIATLVADGNGTSARDVGEAVRMLSMAYGWGLPVDLGYYAQRFLVEQVESLQQLLYTRRLPLADKLVGEFTEALARQQIVQQLPGSNWKSQARLDRAELVRQVRIIDGFLVRGDYATAFGLMREWLVLWTMWCTRHKGHWLRYRDRLPVERLLNRLTERDQRPGQFRRALTEEQTTAAQAWHHARQLRNFFAHRGLDKDITLSTKMVEHITAIDQIWRESLRAVPEFSLELPPPEGRALVSPVGLRPGVLFSALHTADPGWMSRCVVICSAETEGAVRQACEAAEYTGEVVPIRFSDPFAGTDELDRLAEQARGWLDESEEVLVNVTGGTTVMGVLAERIAKNAGRAGRSNRAGRSVHRFALVDRRPVAEQEADPFQVGEVCWLDDPPAGEGT